MSDSQDKLFDAAIEHAKTAFHDHQYEEAKEYLAVGLRMIPIKKLKGKPEPKVEVVEEKKDEINYGMWAFIAIMLALFFWAFIETYGG